MVRIHPSHVLPMRGPDTVVGQVFGQKRNFSNAIQAQQWKEHVLRRTKKMGKVESR